VRPISIRWISDVPSKIVKILEGTGRVIGIPARPPIGPCGWGNAALRHVSFSSRCCSTGCMSEMREELHHLVDELPEAEVRPVLELIRRWADATHDARDLPFFASFESDPDLAERPEEILRAELGP